MLNYRIEGKGLPLLMIHGFGISFKIWHNLRPFLEPYFSLVMIELPGIGRSPAPQGDYLRAAVDAIDELRSALGFESWHVLSYSSGTRVGEEYVRGHPERVGKALFLCPAQTQVYKAIGLRAAKWLDSRFPATGDWVLSSWRLDFLIHLLGFNLSQTPHVAEWMREISSQPAEILKTTIRSLPGDGCEPFLSPHVPHLFIWGIQDLITATPRMPTARDRLIRATHAAPVTEPQQVAEIIIPFLAIT
jgi:pimeloyl-ACP methyl ester carboxylesterase